ncbi:MAG: Hpt domain-containing protein [Rhodocyclales bacterium]|nr:Hpt domain-containing protein [Rhodocyclales bacterium]
MPSLPAPFDRSLVLENLGNDEELFRQIAALFIEDWPNSRQRLAAAVAAVDAEAVRAAAHSIKGAVSNFGADAAVQAAKNLEAAGRAADLARIPALSETLVAAISDVVSALRLDIGS